MFKFAVLTVSDRCSKGEAKDESGKIIMEMINDIDGSNIGYDIVPDEIQLIKDKLIYYCDELKADLVLTTGGTGLGSRDLTPEATNEIANKLIPGISEHIRSEGTKNTKKAILSRGISAIRKNTVIINLPGSPKGVKESLDAVIDIIPHAFSMLKGEGHDKSS